MIHVSHVRGTVKGIVDAALGPKTIIVGPNGSGKSRLQNTVELALLGYASDVVGRAEMRKESDLITLAAGEELTAEATLSDGRVSTYSSKKTKTGAKKADHIKAINAYFPVQDVRGALTGSVETARKWLLQRIAGGVQRGDVTRYLTADCTERYDRKAALLAGQDEVSMLVTILEAARSEKRAKTAELTAAEKTLAALTANLGVEPTESQLEEARRIESEAFTVYENAVKNATLSVKPPLDELKAEAVRFIEAYEAARGEVERLTALVAEAGPPLTKQEDELRVLRYMIAEAAHIHVERGVSVCLVCQSAGPFDHAKRSDELTNANKAAASRDISNHSLQRAQEESEKLLTAANAAIAAYQKAAAEPDFARQGVSVEEARSALATAQGRHSAMRETARRHSEARSHRELERQLKRAIRDAEDLAEGCAEAMGALLRSATETFIKLVQSYLPETDIFGLVLEEEEKEVCRFGFIRNGTLHTALSGAEWARLTLALACAANKPSADTLMVFTPEERAFDPDTLRSVLVALSDAPGQVILTSPVAPSGRLPKGWTLIDLTPTKAKKSAAE